MDFRFKKAKRTLARNSARQRHEPSRLQKTTNTATGRNAMSSLKICVALSVALSPSFSFTLPSSQSLQRLVQQSPAALRPFRRALTTTPLMAAFLGVDERKPATAPNYVEGADKDAPSEYASFAGGCFWGIEKFFRNEFGAALKSTSVGYMGGSKPDPTYEEVCSKTTGHAEALQIEYFPDKVSYAQLCEYLFRIHDPTTPNRQGNDVGPQYRSAIFVHSDEQKAAAEKVKEEMQARWSSPIVTEIVSAKPDDFWRAEIYHQMYLFKNPFGYCNHRPRW
ncbi:unnamed protein product [Vitrella brassicaformis CCMP3155]|uniref:peptide-methionine (S)-S-oxide reductase n=1 Tax=Vitrella brassicaformis (strain CCMP3155) TaxID=1169540 RepID=A0A0G4H3B0_VITBC|nr:unnamed protein product [Vitrella brassicaformis CCMP3155]|eukprot:CEM38195.1 unnamed protein product [Vitrella brassicaformis CCMP3155]